MIIVKPQLPLKLHWLGGTRVVYNSLLNRRVLGMSRQSQDVTVDFFE